MRPAGGIPDGRTGPEWRGRYAAKLAWSARPGRADGLSPGALGLRAAGFVRVTSMRKIVLLLALCALGAGCSSLVPQLKAPDLKVVALNFVGGDPRHQQLRLRIHVTNPNDRAIAVRVIDYQVMLADTHVRRRQQRRTVHGTGVGGDRFRPERQRRSGIAGEGGRRASGPAVAGLSGERHAAPRRGPDPRDPVQGSRPAAAALKRQALRPRRGEIVARALAGVRRAAGGYDPPDASTRRIPDRGRSCGPVAGRGLDRQRLAPLVPDAQLVRWPGTIVKH